MLEHFNQIELHLLVVVSHDVGMVELFQDVDLPNDLLPLPIAHPAIVELLPHQDLPICLPSDSIDRPKTPYTTVVSQDKQEKFDYASLAKSLSVKSHARHFLTYLCLFR